MKGLNEVTLMGTVGKDPEVRFLEGDRKVANFTLATNKTWKDKSGQDKESTEWHSIEAWSYLADLASNYIKKGTNIWLRGELKTDSWEDPQGSGNKKYKTKIVVEKITLLPGGPRNDNGQTQQPVAVPQNQYSQPPVQQPPYQQPLPQQYPQQPPVQQQYPQQPPVQQRPPVQPPVQQRPPVQQQYPQQPPMQQRPPVQPPVQQQYPQQPPVQQQGAVDNAQAQTNQYMTDAQFMGGLAIGQPDDLPF